MRRWILCSSFLLTASLSWGKPRNPLPQTPDQIWQNDLDLLQDINTGLEEVSVSSSNLPSGSTQYIQNRNTLQSGATFYVSSGTVAGDFRVTGNVYFGTGTARALINDMPKVQVEGIDFDGSAIASIRNQDNAGGASLVLSKTRGTTVGSVTAVTNNDILGVIYFSGADGTSVVQGARIQVLVNGTVGTNSMPSEMFLQTAPAGSTTPISNLIVNPGGEITRPMHPSFLVTSSSDSINATGDGTEATVTFHDEIFDQSGAITNSTFTASITSKYTFSVGVRIENTIASHDRYIVSLRTSNRDYNVELSTIGARDFYSHHISVLCDMDANDTAFVTAIVTNSTKVVEISGAVGDRITWFSGNLQD